MVGISSHPILLFNETASGFYPEENWPEYDGGDDDSNDYESVEQVRRDATGPFLTKRATSSKASAPMNASEPVASPGAGRKKKKKENWADFTYTVSMAYAWGRGAGRGKGQARYGGVGGGGEVEDMHVGYLDDEVIFGIGVDDVGQAFARVEMRELVGCMRACPGMDQASH